MKQKASWFYPSVILVISVIALSQILFKNGIAFHGDFSFPISTERFGNVFRMWNPYPSYSFGFQSSMPFTYMLPFLVSMYLLNLSIEALSKLMLLAGLFLAGVSMFLACREILKKLRHSNARACDIASLLAALFYMFNPWSMDRVGHYFLWVSYGFAPLVLLLAMKLTDKDKVDYKLVFLTALVWAVASAWPFGTSMNGLLLFSWAIYSAFLAMLSGQPEKVVLYLKVFVSTFILYLIFNAHWILPYATSSLTQTIKPAYIVSLESVEVLGSNSSYLNVMRLTGYWWSKVQYWPNPPLNALWILASALLPLVVLAIALFKRNRYGIYLLLVYVASIFLSMGLNNPFPQIYKWMLFDAPFSNSLGWVFRDPNKWNGLTALAYSFLLGIFLLEMFSRNTTLRNVLSLWKIRFQIGHVRSSLVVLAAVVLITLYTGPTAFGYLAQVYTPVNIPREYYQANEWLRNQDGDFRVLWLAPLSQGTPVLGMLRYSWAPNKPYTSIMDSWSSSKPSMAPTTYEAQRYTQFLYESITEGRGFKYLIPLGIKYIVYHNDIYGAEIQGQRDIANLMNQNELELVWQKGFAYIFRVHSYTPRISAPRKTLLVIGGLDSLSSLHLIPSFDFENTSVLFLEQRFYDKTILDLTNNVAIFDKDTSDLALSFLDQSYLVTPFDYTIHSNTYNEWSKTNVYEDWWNAPSARSFAGYWDWDYGLGLVKTTASKAKLVMDYEATISGRYSIWLRYYESLAGGRISLSVNETRISEIDTVGERGFIWRKIGFASLNEGEHDLVLENINGFNAVNLVALVPDSIEEKLFNLTQNVRITHIITPSIMRTEQHVSETEGVLFRGYDALLSTGGFEEPLRGGPVTPNLQETLPFPIAPWTATQWTGTSRSLTFGVDEDENFEGGSSAVVESLNIANKGTIDFRTERRASIEVLEPNKDSKRLYVSVMYKTSDDYITEEGVKLNVYTEDSNGKWLGDFTSPIFESSPEWRRIYYIVDLPTETARFSPEIVTTSFKGKVWFDNFDLAYKITSISNNKEALILDEKTVAHANIAIKTSSTWTLAMYAQSGLEGLKLSLKTDSTDINLPLRASDNNGQLLRTDPMSLNAIDYALRVTSSASTSLIGIALYPWMQNSTDSETKNSPQVLNFTQISSSEWIVNVNTTEPFMLGLTESYDPFWTASAEDFGTKSLPMYSIVNGFYISKTGSYKLYIRYDPEFYFNTGLWITSSSITVSTLLVGVSLEREKHYVSRIITRLHRRKRD